MMFGEFYKPGATMDYPVGGAPRRKAKEGSLKAVGTVFGWGFPSKGTRGWMCLFLLIF